MKWFERALHMPSTAPHLSEQEQKAEYWIAKHSNLVAGLESRLGPRTESRSFAVARMPTAASPCRR